jgi:hypothetical protein
VEKLRETAMVSFLYTPAFRQELKRRYGILYTDAQRTELLNHSGAKTLDECIAKRFPARPEQPLPQARGVGPVDEWKGPPK